MKAKLMRFTFAIGMLIATGIYAQSSPPQTKPCGPTATEIFNFRERCAKQAQEEFRSLGYSNKSFAGLSNHYSVAMDKCFMLIEDMDVGKDVSKDPNRNIVTSKTLSDAYERKVYGTYIWSTDKPKKYWEVPPLDCRVSLPSGEERFCKSLDEFQELIGVYMGKDGLK